jgi:hypothetical protein
MDYMIENFNLKAIGQSVNIICHWSILWHGHQVLWSGNTSVGGRWDSFDWFCTSKILRSWPAPKPIPLSWTIQPHWANRDVIFSKEAKWDDSLAVIFQWHIVLGKLLILRSSGKNGWKNRQKISHVIVAIWWIMICELVSHNMDSLNTKSQ